MASSAEVSNDTFSSSMGQARNYNRWVVSTFEGFLGRSLLEIGMGHGGFYEHLPALDAYTGLDIDGNLIDHARRRYPDRRFIQADVADPSLAARLADTPFDTVLCVNVLEHVEDDRAAVAGLLQLLVPGGHLLLFVPAFRQLYTDLDKLAGHLRRYTRRDVAALLPRDGVRIRKLDYFNPIGGIGWWANRLMRHGSLESTEVTGQVAVFDTYILPVSRMIDPLTRNVFGQSVVCVAEKL